MVAHISSKEFNKIIGNKSGFYNHNHHGNRLLNITRKVEHKPIKKTLTVSCSGEYTDTSKRFKTWLINHLWTFYLNSKDDSELRCNMYQLLRNINLVGNLNNSAILKWIAPRDAINAINQGRPYYDNELIKYLIGFQSDYNEPVYMLYNEKSFLPLTDYWLKRLLYSIDKSIQKRVCFDKLEEKQIKESFETSESILDTY